MSSESFDYIIVGGGAAGLQLAMFISSDPWFKDKKILLIEKEAKDKDDRTWCFWEKGRGLWDDIVHKQWNKGIFNTDQRQTALHLSPYAYKMIKAIDFYTMAKKTIQDASNIEWLKSSVHDVFHADGRAHVKTDDGEYVAALVFDSRIDPEFREKKEAYSTLVQHFKGWEIKTATDSFEPSEFVMMDFQKNYKDATSFFYVLPTDRRTALVEFTFFNQDLLEKEEYDVYLKRYITEVLGIDKYEILKTEYGEIPMTDYPFHKKRTKGVTKIGTAGSWVKPSSGYAFKNIERYSKLLIENVKNGSEPTKGLLNPLYRLYDALILDVLKERNELGEGIFAQMYERNSIQNIFAFLDEELSFGAQYKILRSFDQGPFIRAVRRRYLGF